MLGEGLPDRVRERRGDSRPAGPPGKGRVRPHHPRHPPCKEPGDAPVTGFVYFANPDNPNWLGPATLPDIARQVRRSHGPSGANTEYVLQLAAALRDMGVEDAHVFALADLVKESRAP